jgi:hypothetical protein
VFFHVGYLKALSSSSLYNVVDRKINEYEGVSGMRIGRGKQMLDENPP